MKRNPKQLADQVFDLLVVGGGIYGACIFWDATLRGLSAALIEKGDFGGATSANSLKIMHGGLRYLQDADISLVRMMNQERSTFLKIAPHLVQPLPFLIPTDKSLKRNKLLMRLALMLNDLAGYDRNKLIDPEKFIPNGSLLSYERYADALPELPNPNVTGGALWHDGQIYDTERLTLSFVRAAAERGATAANYLAADGLVKDGDQVIGVKARDLLNNTTFDIRALVTVNAAGPWIDQVLEGLPRSNKEKYFVHSLAVNVITRKLIEDYAVGILSQPAGTKNGDAAQDSQMLFVSPWRDRSIIGTFHWHHKDRAEDFKVSELLVGKIVHSINLAYPEAGFSFEDISLVHAGFLPEKERHSGRKVNLIRRSRLVDHRRRDGIGGLITVVGVKYTTSRKAAQEAVDLVFDLLNQHPPPCKTHLNPVHAGDIENFGEYLNQKINIDSGIIEPATIDHLVRSYGSEYPRLRGMMDFTNERKLAGSESKQILNAQVQYAIREEMAVKLPDVILRRTGLGTTGKPDEESLLYCADVMARELGWDEADRRMELEQARGVYDLA